MAMPKKGGAIEAIETIEAIEAIEAIEGIALRGWRRHGHAFHPILSYAP